MLIYLMILIYIIQMVYNIYVTLCLLYYTFEYIQLDCSKYAKLTMLTSYWKIKIEDELPKIYRGKKCLGNLEYHSLSNTKRIIKADKWYEIDCFFGFYKEIEPAAEITEKPDMDIFMLGSMKEGILGIMGMMFVVVFEIMFPYLDEITDINPITQRIAFIIVPLFIFCLYFSGVIINHISKKNAKQIKLKLKIKGEEDFRYNLIMTGKIVIETVQNNYKGYILKDSNDTDSDMDYLFYNEYGEHEITAYQKLTPEKMGFFTKFQYMLVLPLKGAYVLCTKRYKAEWYKRIRTHCPKITIIKDIKDNETLTVNVKESRYDEEKNKYYPGSIKIKGHEPIKKEYIFNEHDTKYCYYEYVRQVMSIPALFFALMVLVCISNRMKIVPAFWILLVITVVTFILGIPHLRKEYKRKEEIEEKLRRFEEYRKNNDIE